MEKAGGRDKGGEEVENGGENGRLRETLMADVSFLLPRNSCFQRRISRRKERKRERKGDTR